MDSGQQSRARNLDTTAIIHVISLRQWKKRASCLPVATPRKESVTLFLVGQCANNSQECVQMPSLQSRMQVGYQLAQSLKEHMLALMPKYQREHTIVIATARVARTVR